MGWENMSLLLPPALSVCACTHVIEGPLPSPPPLHQRHTLIRRHNHTHVPLPLPLHHLGRQHWPHTAIHPHIAPQLLQQVEHPSALRPGLNAPCPPLGRLVRHACLAPEQIAQVAQGRVPEFVEGGLRGGFECVVEREEGVQSALEATQATLHRGVM